MHRSKLSGVAIALAALFILVFSIAGLSILTTVSALDVALTVTPNPNAPAFASDVEAGVAAADPAKGQTLFNTYGCVACHGNENGTAPYVVGLGTRAATRRPNYSAAAYIYESIIEPNAFVVQDYPTGLMMQNFKSIIPDDQLYNLVAWLLTQ
jgi:cytochrome c553